MKKSVIKIVSLLMIVALNWAGLSAIGNTFAYFNDIESSEGNVCSAGTLDFSLGEGDWDPYEKSFSLFPGDTIIKDITVDNHGSLDFQYIAKTEKIGGSDDLCNTLLLRVWLEGNVEYEGYLVDFDLTPSLITVGAGGDDWVFELTLPEGASDALEELYCGFKFVFEAGQGELAPGEGFSDIEESSNEIWSGIWGVVLNEFLPNPDGVEYGFDFGTDSSDMPQGEWVELYNNHNKIYDLTGWFIKDNLISDVNKILISDTNTQPATTTIAPYDWFVVYMNKAVLNNSGDDVRLFDSNGRLVDFYTYSGADYCELEPTPEDENSTTTAGGSCGEVPPNKSYARIPDGIGDWVDPIPTPGGVNILSEAEIDMVGAGAIASIETIATEPEITEEAEEEPAEEEPDESAIITNAINEAGESSASSDESATATAATTTEAGITEDAPATTEDVIESEPVSESVTEDSAENEGAPEDATEEATTTEEVLDEEPVEPEPALEPEPPTEEEPTYEPVSAIEELIIVEQEPVITPDAESGGE